jgi:hypothetical protein
MMTTSTLLSSITLDTSKNAKENKENTHYSLASQQNQATGNRSPVATDVGLVQLPVFMRSCNWTLKH